MADKKYDFLFKLLIIGDSCVNKTRLLLSFCSDDAFQYNSFLGVDFRIKTVEIGGKKIKLQIWDTAGQEKFHTITTSYYRGASGIILVYDITNPKTFDNIPKWLSNVDKHVDADVEKIILGDNCDMEDRRQVAKEKGDDLAKQHNIPFFEISANSGINVQKAFLQLVETILAKKY